MIGVSLPTQERLFHAKGTNDEIEIARQTSKSYISPEYKPWYETIQHWSEEDKLSWGVLNQQGTCGDDDKKRLNYQMI